MSPRATFVLWVLLQAVVLCGADVITDFYVIQQDSARSSAPSGWNRPPCSGSGCENSGGLDLNRASGGDYIYLYYKYDANPQSSTRVISQIMFTSGACSSPWSDPVGGHIDMNAKAGGDYIYMCVQYGYASGTSVVRSIQLVNQYSSPSPASWSQQYVSGNLNAGTSKGDNIWFLWSRNTCSKTCQNGGTCGQSECNCPAGYGGVDCLSLGDSPSYPGFSCNHIMKSRGVIATGTYYVRTPSGNVRPVMCDFTMFPRRAATLLYKLSAGVSGDPYTLWTSSTTTPDSTSALTMQKTSSHYTNEYISAGNWGKISQASARIYKNGVSQQYVNFNTYNSSTTSWFAGENVVSSSWSDMMTSTVSGSYFSILGLPPSRRWYIDQGNFQGCPADAGWMNINYATDTCEGTMYAGVTRIAIKYSPTTTSTNVQNSHVFGDVFAIWGDVDTETGVESLNPGEIPAFPALSCDHVLKLNNSAPNGVYYLRTPTGKLAPSLCNFNMLPGQGYTLLAKFSKQVDNNTLSLWQSGSVNPLGEHLLNTLPSSSHYVNPFVSSWLQFSVPWVTVRVHDDNAEKQYMTFNGTGTSVTSWFSFPTLRSTSWTDMLNANTGVTGFFVQPVLGGDANRQFAAIKSYNGCTGDYIWLTVFVDRDDVCQSTFTPLKTNPPRVTIGYSSLSTASLSSVNTFTEADDITIWGTVARGGAAVCTGVTCDSDKTCVESLGGCTSVCDYDMKFTKPAGSCDQMGTNVTGSLSLTGGKWPMQYRLDSGAWLDIPYSPSIPLTFAVDVPYVIQVRNSVGCNKRTAIKIKRGTVPKTMPAPILAVDTANQKIQVMWNNLIYPGDTGSVPLNAYTIKYRSICANTSAWISQNFTSTTNQFSFAYAFGTTYEVVVFASNCFGSSVESGIATIQGDPNPSQLSISPPSDLGVPTSGGPLTLAAKNLGSNMLIYVDGSQRSDCTVPSSAQGNIVCQIAAGSGSHNITVILVESSCSEQIVSLAWAYTLPNITSTTSLGGLGGNMTISGTNFGVIGTSTVVTIDDVSCSNCSVVSDHNKILCSSCPGGKGAGHKIVVKSKQLVSAPYPFSYPVCNPVCVFGECVADGVCKCNSGYGGNDCSEEQFCSGTSFQFSSCGACQSGLCCHFAPSSVL